MNSIEQKKLELQIPESFKVLVISPFSRVTKNKTKSPKDYPYWKDIITSAKEKGYYIIQIGINGEDDIGADKQLFDKSLDYLKDLVKCTDKWISVDNFFHHLAWYYEVSGIVIWGPSDPRIFGHDLHLNLLKDRKYLRENQFGEWHEIKYDKNIFPSPAFILEEL